MRNTQVFLSLPSVELSQKHVLAVCIPAPFFCMMTQVTNRTREDNKIKKNTLGNSFVVAEKHKLHIIL